jgi:hypothetical protein
MVEDLVCVKVLLSLEMTVKPQKQKCSRYLFVIRSWYFSQYESGPVPLLQTSPFPTHTHKRVDNLQLCTFSVKPQLAVARTSQTCSVCPSFRRASRNSCCCCFVLQELRSVPVYVLKSVLSVVFSFIGNKVFENLTYVSSSLFADDPFS